MKKISLALVAAILASLQFIFTFVNAGTTDTILSFEVNIWVSRAFWLSIAVACFVSHFKRK